MKANISPFERFKHLKPEEYEAFAKRVSTPEFRAKRERYKALRAKNKHPHRLGTGGYKGKMQKWKDEDQRLADEGRPNPWREFPTERCQNWLRARGHLTESGEISFNSEATKEVAAKAKQLDDEHEGSGNGRDALTKALGNDEHQGLFIMQTHHIVSFMKVP